MKLTMFSEAYKTLDGKAYPNGQDALPYADDSILIVADGVGGDGSFKETEFNKALFDEDKFIDILFGGVACDIENPCFREFVKESFAGFFGTKECYFEEQGNLRPSSYFGSRVATALMLDIKLNSPLFSEKKVFEELSALETKEEKRKYLDIFANELHAKLKTGMVKVAANGGFREPPKDLLFPTTLTATLYNKCDDGKNVEVINIAAGDSRSYVILHDGMSQTQDDYETAGGAMLTKLCANPKEGTGINCNYLKLPIPCILFNSSDGCFDSKKFINQVVFEEVILKAISENDCMESVSQTLKEYFAEAGIHDDSSTLAMSALGFADYTELKAFADKRLAAIKEAYKPDDFEDIFEVNYSESLILFDSKKIERYASAKDVIAENEGVVKFCQEILEADVATGRHYLAVPIKRLREQISGFDARLAPYNDEIFKILRKYYAWFAFKLGITGLYSDLYGEKLQKLKNDIKLSKEDFISEIEGFEQWLTRANGVVEQLKGLATSSDFAWTYSELDIRGLEQCDTEIKRAEKSLFQGIIKKKNSYINRIARKKQEFFALNEQLADAQGIEKIIRAIIESDTAVESLDIFIEDKADFVATFEKYATVYKQKLSLTLELEKKVAAYMSACFKKNYARIWEEIEKGTIVLEGGVIAEIREDEARQRDALVKKVERQKAIFALYDKGYNRFLFDTTGTEGVI